MQKRAQKLGMLSAAAVGLWVCSATVLRHSRRYDPEGKNVLITGGSRGLGLLLAREFCRQGARVAICARNKQELGRARLVLAADGYEVLPVACDVCDRDQVEGAITQIRNQLGSIQILVNNAGMITVGPFETMNNDDYKESMETHFWGPLNAIIAVLPEMRQKREGRIVNISSIGGKIAVPHLLPYSVGKFALTGLSEGLRSEAMKDNVYVTTVCPGLMRTGSPRNAKFKGRHRDEYTWFSISDALPLLSMSAKRAAKQIVKACRYGDAELVLSFPAKLAIKLHGLFPVTGADVLALINRLLPGAADGSEKAYLGKESSSEWSPSWITALNERAAKRNNEVA
jgi:NAD(P)-dependent dehydrogenase (short-subunit alcohol dehydrogenase family)